MNHSIDMLEIVAEGFGDILDQVVFVGGAVASLYYENPASPSIRPTDDVDCVISVCTYTSYMTFLSDLEGKGFKHDMSDDASPICRLHYKGVKVDVMSKGNNVLGFTNSWYDSGIENSTTSRLPSGREIRIFTLPYFLASKIEAFHSRGEGDIRCSHDIEDCIFILDGLKSLTFPTGDSAQKVREFLTSEFTVLADKDDFIETISSCMRKHGSNAAARTARILDIIRKAVS